MLHPFVIYGYQGAEEDAEKLQLDMEHPYHQPPTKEKSPRVNQKNTLKQVGKCVLRCFCQLFSQNAHFGVPTEYASW